MCTFFAITFSNALWSNEGDQWVNYKGVDVNGVQLKKKPGSVRHEARTIRENRSALKVSPCKFLTVCSLHFKPSLSTRPPPNPFVRHRHGRENNPAIIRVWGNVSTGSVVIVTSDLPFSETYTVSKDAHPRTPAWFYSRHSRYSLFAVILSRRMAGAAIG